MAQNINPRNRAYCYSSLALDKDAIKDTIEKGQPLQFMLLGKLDAVKKET